MEAHLFDYIYTSSLDLDVHARLTTSPLSSFTIL